MCVYFDGNSLAYNAIGLTPDFRLDWKFMYLSRTIEYYFICMIVPV